jgi:magnesium-transporting ATPase (P-type)
MPKAMVLHPFTSTHRRNAGDGARADAPAGAADPRGSPHRKSAEAVVEALGSDSARGLSQAEVQRRLDLHGPNRLKSAPETPWWRRLL